MATEASLTKVFLQPTPNHSQETEFFTPSTPTSAVQEHDEDSAGKMTLIDNTADWKDTVTCREGIL